MTEAKNPWEGLAEAEPSLAYDLAARVARGAALLDQAESGWYLRVAADELAMESCDQCILGQLHGDYLDGFSRVSRWVLGRAGFSSSDYGFVLTLDEQDAECQAETMPSHVAARFAALGELWRREVRSRLMREDRGS